MQKNINKTKKSESILKNKSKLILVCFLIYTTIFILASLVSLAVNIGSGLYTPVALVGFSLASFVSGFYAGRKIRQKGMVYGALFTLPANIASLLISMILNGFKADYYLFFSLVLLIVFSALGGILSVNIKVKTRIKR